jgi:peptidoglycan/LPS O-acetylase OafA/YrhL
MIPRYRADIDGLRAVAVLAVLLFHGGSGIFSGGYVGVDIFFVISGYLITTIIVREIANGSFSIARFYERRARRILPALAAVIVATLVAGAFLLTPDALVELAHSAEAAALFSSNVLFYLSSGYFEAPENVRPLLHTWSLAVEEQYYIFFPLLLILIARFGARRYVRWLVSLGLLSFVTCVAVTHFDASAAFYLIPARAWELFIGSALSLGVFPVPQRRRVREIAAALGATLMAVAIFGYTSATSFPGAAAVLPTVGAALVIYAGCGGESLVSRVLSLRPVVFIGLISYSLYLWHWPVIAYTRLYAITEPDPLQMGAMLVLVFALSILSWRYIETPLRTKRMLPTTTPLLKASVVTLLVLFCSGAALARLRGLPHRYGTSFAAPLTAADPEWAHWGNCQAAFSRQHSAAGLCDLGVPGGAPSFLLWGDSHARALASGVQLSAARLGLTGKLATHSACPPLGGIERPSRTSCEAFNQAVLRMLAHSPQIKTVLLAARWALSAEGTRYGHESGTSVHLVDLQSPGTTTRSDAELVEIGLWRTIDRLHRLGKQVVLVRAIPEVGYDVPSAYFVAHATGRDANALIAPARADYRRRTAEVRALFAQIAAQQPVAFVDPARYLCTDICPVVRSGHPMYRDDDHLSTFGSRYLAPAFDGVFAGLAVAHTGPGARSPAQASSARDRAASGPAAGLR